MHHSEAPIGIFDSGVGGLTVARAISEALPKESFIYYGDTAHLPYGDKSAEAITKYSRAIVRFLIDEGCKAIVIACNTASAVAYEALLDEFSEIPIINVIDPVAEAVALRPIQRVGVIGTRATVQSGAYAQRLQTMKPGLDVHSLATPLLVPVIEEGLAGSAISDLALKHYLSNPELQNVDALILACTHYPILHHEIDTYFNHRVRIIDSPQIVAEMVSQVLAARKLLSKGRHAKHTFFLSNYTSTFEKIARSFFGDAIELVEKKVT